MVLFSVLLCLLLLVMEEVGRKLGKRHVRDGDKAGLGTIEASLFGLLALLVGFTFAGASSRMETRRQQIPQEANAVGTAWLRLDLLPDESRNELHKLFREYMDCRVRTYEVVPDVDEFHAELKRAGALQQRIWDKATVAVKAAPDGRLGMLVLPPLNEMFDIVTTRTQSMRMHTPWIVYAMLVVVAMVCALLAGYEMAGAKRRSVLHMAAFALVTGAAVYLILELEFPRLGIVRLDTGDTVMRDLRQSWGD